MQQHATLIFRQQHQLNMKRSLRGPSRTTREDSSALLLIEQNTTSLLSDKDEYAENGLLLTIICALILLPCVVAGVAQCLYWVKQKRKKRNERILEAVSTHPTSRMIVLSEIFKNDSRVSLHMYYIYVA